ncbi:MAG: hypothetical protein GXY32_01210 [Ruminococcaceae bacterium]|nr:hypothetical protein [Oscillospiraceae bacterium]
MTGLEKIIGEIRDEAGAEAAEILAKAKAEADAILADAKAKSDEKTAQIAAAAQQDVADIERSRESAQGLQRRQRTLATKQMLLAETRQKALESLYALPEKDYFELLARLAAGAAHPGAGVLILNAADLARVPSGFEKQLAGALPKGTALEVSKDTRPIDGGFVLKYGDVEENCSFRAMFDARSDEFSDLVRDTLFA